MYRLVVRLAAATTLVVSALGGPGATASTSGINDFACRPTTAHPEPVVLLHGLGANAQSNMGMLAHNLSSAGYCVFTTTYGTTWYGGYVGGLASMRTSAGQIDAFVARVRSSTGAAKVDLVGHSEGTTVGAYYLKFLGGSAEVARFVGFGSNFQGTTLGGLQALADMTGFRPVLEAGGCTACNEYAPGSAFMRELNAGGVAVAGPAYTSIVTQYDQVVNPYTSGLLAPAPNVTDIELQDVCGNDYSGHLALAVNPNVFALVRNALDPASAAPVGCVPMPFVG